MISHLTDVNLFKKIVKDNHGTIIMIATDDNKYDLNTNM